MSEDQSGIYSCTATLPNERRSFISAVVRVKPDIILSQGKIISVSEGQDVLLECLLVKGVQAKRVWQFNGEYEYGDRTRTRNQGGLLMIQKALPQGMLINQVFELTKTIFTPTTFFLFFSFRFWQLHLLGSKERNQ